MNKREELETLLKSKKEEFIKLNEEILGINDKINSLPVNNFANDLNPFNCYINESGLICDYSDTNIEFYNLTDNYNYFTNKEYAEKVSYKQLFERKLLAYKEKNGDKCDWNNEDESKYNAYITVSDNEIKITTCYWSKDSCISFNSKELLEKHIEENKDEWVKYFNICNELD